MTEFDPDAFLTMTVHGEAKKGKTHFGATAPGKNLFLDAEAGGMRFVPGSKVNWDPLREDVPDMSDYNICRVEVNSTGALDAAIAVIEHGEHPFTGVTFDSLSEYQSRLKRELTPGGQLDQQGWGEVLVTIEDQVMKLRDSVAAQSPTMRYCLIITGTQFRDDKWRPLLQGGMKDRLSYKLDCNAFLYTQRDDSGNLRRALRIEGDGKTDAGNRFPGDWGEIIWDPNMTKILKKLNDNVKELKNA